ncbi:RNA polymerase sigma factor SigF, partial [Streptomyces sp. SID5785]|nr:RNA polymerase sigma factor SigF [Streptomyces sp. SID5785]
MSADQGSSKVLTLSPGASVAPDDRSESATAALIDTPPAPAPAAVPAQPDGTETSGALDTRTLSRSLFLRLATLDEHSPERAYVRDTLIELNLPLVRYAAARFRSRNEPMED